MACSESTAQELRQFDNGVRIVAEIVDCTIVNGEPVEEIVDVSSMLSAQIILRKPDGRTVLVMDATHLTDGKDGLIYYITVGDPVNHTGDLDQAGTWSIQGRVQMPNGYYTSIKTKFKVKTVLDT